MPSPATFGIGAIVQLTGLSDHVIRAWERRYAAIEPTRNPAGTRRYSEADVERLKLLRDGIAAGHRIGALAGLVNEEIRALLARIHRQDSTAEIEEMLEAIRRLDVPELERLLTREALALGPFDFCHSLVGELLDRVGAGWAQGKLCVAEEHMATAAIKSILMSLLRFGTDRVSGEMMVFSTLPHERHELGALMAAVCAQNAGARVVYLGPDLPVSEIVTAVRRSGAKVVGVSAALAPEKKNGAALPELRNRLPGTVELWIGGRGWADFDHPTGVRLIGDLDRLQHRVGRRSINV